MFDKLSNLSVRRTFSTFLLITSFSLLIVSCSGGGGGGDSSDSTADGDPANETPTDDAPTNDNPTDGDSGTGIADPGCPKVVFIKNDAADGGDGSKQKPFNTLTALGYPEAKVIYMMTGTGTALNQDAGIVLYPGQKLFGDSINFSDGCNSIKAVRSSTTTGPLPSITSSAGAAINLQGDNEVAGIRLDSPLLGILVSSVSGVSSVTNIHNNILKHAGISALIVSGEIVIDSNEITNSSITIVDDDTMLNVDEAALNITVKDNVLAGADSGITLSSTTTGQGTATITGNIIKNTTGRVAIQVVNRSGVHTVENNTISDTDDAGIEFDNVSGIGAISNNTITSTLSESISVQTQTNQNLELTIERNVLNDSQSDIDRFASGIVLTMRDGSTITGTLSNNMINDAGRHGIFIHNLNNSQSVLTVDGNTVNDADSIGLFLDNRSDDSVSTVVSNNVVNRSGENGIEVRVFNSGNNSYTLANNQIADASSNGLVVNMQGDFNLNKLDIKSNTINGNFKRGIDFLKTSGGASSPPIITTSIIQNTFTGNGDEGIRLFVEKNSDVRSYITENSFINNGGKAGLYARAASVDGIFCIVLADNESDNDYKFQVVNDGTLGYEDFISTNIGAVILDEVSGLLGAVAVDTCSKT